MTTDSRTSQDMPDEPLDIHWVASTLRVGMDAAASLYGDSEDDGVHTDDTGNTFVRITRFSQDGHVIGHTRMYVSFVDEGTPG